MSVAILRGDARRLPLPDASVDLIVTSPPYFGLRSYTDGGEHYAGQIGSEATPAEYVAALLDCTREWVRVLKPTGSLFVNLGDKYAQDTERSRNGLGSRQTTQPGGLQSGGYIGESTISLGKRDNGGIPRKSLMGLPWRYALACIDDLGLILRAEIIWAKPNGLPESVTDRVRRSHELAAAEARTEAGRLAALVEDGEARRAYHQFARPFAEANDASREHGGAWWDGQAWRNMEGWS